MRGSPPAGPCRRRLPLHWPSPADASTDSRHGTPRSGHRRRYASQQQELADDPEGELSDLVAYWTARGLDPDLARQVAEQLTAHDAVAAQLDADHGLEEITPERAPLLAGTQTALAFAIGAAVPLLITYLVPLAIEDTLIIVAVLVSLTLTSIVAAGVGRVSALRMVMRSLTVGLGTMAVSYLAGQAFF